MIHIEHYYAITRLGYGEMISIRGNNSLYGNPFFAVNLFNVRIILGVAVRGVGGSRMVMLIE